MKCWVTSIAERGRPTSLFSLGLIGLVPGASSREHRPPNDVSIHPDHRASITLIFAVYPHRFVAVCSPLGCTPRRTKRDCRVKKKQKMSEKVKQKIKKRSPGLYKILIYSLLAPGRYTRVYVWYICASVMHTLRSHNLCDCVRLVCTQKRKRNKNESYTEFERMNSGERRGKINKN